MNWKIIFLETKNSHLTGNFLELTSNFKKIPSYFPTREPLNITWIRYKLTVSFMCYNLFVQMFASILCNFSPWNVRRVHLHLDEFKTKIDNLLALIPHAYILGVFYKIAFIIYTLKLEERKHQMRHTIVSQKSNVYQGGREEGQVNIFPTRWSRLPATIYGPDKY